jgi:hypothetical protein
MEKDKALLLGGLGLGALGLAAFAVSKTGKEEEGEETPVYTTLAVSISPSSAGAVTVSPDKTKYPYNDTVTLVAAPNSGYIFHNWLINGVASGTSSTKTLTMNSNKTVVAMFNTSGGEEPEEPEEPQEPGDTSPILGTILQVRVNNEYLNPGANAVVDVSWKNTGNHAFKPTFRLDIKNKTDLFGTWQEGAPKTALTSVAAGATGVISLVRAIPSDWTNADIGAKIVNMDFNQTVWSPSGIIFTTKAVVGGAETRVSGVGELGLSNVNPAVSEQVYLVYRIYNLTGSTIRVQGRVTLTGQHTSYTKSLIADNGAGIQTWDLPPNSPVGQTVNWIMPRDNLTVEWAAYVWDGSVWIKDSSSTRQMIVNQD